MLPAVAAAAPRRFRLPLDATKKMMAAGCSCYGVVRWELEAAVVRAGKIQDLVPCVLVTFDKEQIVVWRGKNYNAEAQSPSNELFSSDDTVNCDSGRKGWDTSSDKTFDSDSVSFGDETSLLQQTPA